MKELKVAVSQAFGHTVTSDMLLEAWDLFDKDGSGTVDAQEFAQAMVGTTKNVYKCITSGFYSQILLPF